MSTRSTIMEDVTEEGHYRRTVVMEGVMSTRMDAAEDTDMEGLKSTRMGITGVQPPWNK